MDEQLREHVRDDLRGVIRGELLFDDLSRALYSTDASIFAIEPLGVVVPRDEEDLQSLVRYAAANQVPLVPRGAGTGFAGESLGWGLVVDLSRHFRSILEIGDDFIRAQPGVVHRDLNAALAAQGRRLAIDPASTAQCTIGGMAATNASGAHALRHGYMSDHVRGLRVIWDNGDVDWVNPEGLSSSDACSGRVRDIYLQTRNLLENNAQLIQGNRRRTPHDRCGYILHDVLAEGRLNLVRLLVGSEGTLGFFSEITLRTLPLPGGRSLVLLGFESLEKAIQAAQRALPSRPAACELIDRRLVSLARGRDSEVAGLVPPASEAILLVEYETDGPEEAKAAAEELVDRLSRRDRLAILATIASEPQDIAALWQLREQALPGLYLLRGGKQPLPFIEDVGVPTEELAHFLYRLQEILRAQDVTASFLIHAGAGQVHTRPFLDLAQEGDVAKMWALAESVHTLALELGGTISSQHGTGLARTPWVARQHGPLYPVLRELKAIFDPKQLLNPGKIIGPDPGRQAWPLRPRKLLDRAPTLLRWPLGQVRQETLQCNGCGQCRTQEPTQRMCPVFRATNSEPASPRSKANLLQHLLQDQVDPRLLSSDEVREVADLCVNCKMCLHECPAHVNIPKLMLEVKAANVAEHGLSRSDWALSRTESFAAFGSRLAPLVNLGMRSTIVRWLLEKSFGISRKRRLPPFSRRSFLRHARRKGWTAPPPADKPCVVYFVDVFANYNDPTIALATVAVLEHCGFAVHVPAEQRGCGMAPLAYGDVDAAREAAEHNLRIFGDLARQGHRILCSEPTAALMLKQDCLDLVDDPDARLVADRTVELTHFLWELKNEGRLPADFRPLPVGVGHHVPCHLKALSPTGVPRSLLSLIPELRLRTIDVSCSGMAGTYGLKAENYETSLAAGAPLLAELRQESVQLGAAECSSCRMQMEHGSGKQSLHPIQLLAMSYGLLPSWTARNGDKPK